MVRPPIARIIFMLIGRCNEKIISPSFVWNNNHHLTGDSILKIFTWTGGREREGAMQVRNKSVSGQYHWAYNNIQRADYISKRNRGDNIRAFKCIHLCGSDLLLELNIYWNWFRCRIFLRYFYLFIEAWKKQHKKKTSSQLFAAATKKKTFPISLLVNLNYYLKLRELNCFSCSKK